MMGDADNKKRAIPWKPVFVALSTIGTTGPMVASRNPCKPWVIVGMPACLCSNCSVMPLCSSLCPIWRWLLPWVDRSIPGLSARWQVQRRV